MTSGAEAPHVTFNLHGRGVGMFGAVSIEDPLKVTKTVYTVLDFLDWQRAESLELRPYFQRGNVWTPKAKSFFIDTILRGYPVPIIFLQNKTDSHTLRNVRQVVDGQQRLRTLLAYIDIDCLPDSGPSDDVKIMRTHNRELANASFAELPKKLQDRLTSTELSVHVLPSKLDDADLLQLFARLNSTGERLNDQELRNAEFHGLFKSLAYDLAYSQLDRWRDWGLFTPPALAQMREVELTSELITVILRGIVGKSKPMLDQIYRNYDDEFSHAEEVDHRFRATFDALDKLFQPDSRRGGLGILQTQSWIYALFAAVVSSSFGAPLESTDWSPSAHGASSADWLNAAHLAKIRLESGEVPEQVAKALRGASSDRSSRQARYDFLVSGL